ncbi:MAG TPA: FAD-binding oxidoreductase [Solirubrobacteraceae bacterium]|nr:FAD-binding oxidoreductase [Solirubrobacteraceae bacterium]
MGDVDRRTFLQTAAASGLVLVTGADLGCSAGAAREDRHITTARRRRAAVARPGPPIPRTIGEAIRGPVFTPDTPGYSGAARVYNMRFDSERPRWVARPLDASDVSNAIRWAVQHEVPMRARSGGHSYAGYSTLDGGLVLDLRKLSRISFDRRAGIATIGAGAQLIDVYAALAGRAATIPAGTCPSVGIGGHALGGGMGFAGRAFGLALDNLVALELVTADGLVRTVSERSEPELFWALRGSGGGNFAVVTQLSFRVHPLPPAASWVILSWPWSEAGDALAAWQDWQPGATDRFSSVFHLETSPEGPTASVVGQYLGAARDLPHLLSSLRSVPGATLSFEDEAYLPLQMRWAGCVEQSFASCHTEGTYPGGSLLRADFRGASDYVNRPLPAPGRAAATQAMEARQGQPGSGAILFDAYGGAINRVASDDTAFVHRDSLCCLQYLTYTGDQGWIDDTRASMRPYVSGYCYQNYIDPTLRNWEHAYYGSNYRRLEAVRRQFDPEHRFKFPQGIG